MTTSAVRHDLPLTRLNEAAVADLQLHLDGVRLPWQRLGGQLDDVDAGTAPPGDGEHPQTEVVVPTADGHLAVAAGGLLLCDREHTPLARLSEARAVPAPSDDVVVLTGRVVPVRRREARLFGADARTPAQLGVRPDRQVVVAGRPPLQGELTGMRSRSGELVLLVPVEGPTPDGLPPSVLMRCVRRAAAVEAPDAQIVPVALAWRDPGSDAALSAALGRAYGATATSCLVRSDAWVQALTELRAGRGAPGSVLPGVRAALTNWLPPRERRGLVVLLTGLSGSGKSTLARGLVEHVLTSTERTVSLLDGDDVRRLLSSGLGFDRAARDLNVRRIGYVATEIARHGGIAVCAPIAPYAETRAAVRRMVEPVGDFLLVHVSTPLAECERRDLKGLYARARAGEVTEFTGISDPYDVPTDAEIRIDTSLLSRASSLDSVLDHLVAGGWLRPEVRS